MRPRSISIRNAQIAHLVEESRSLEPEFCDGATWSTDNRVDLAKGRHDVFPICVRQCTQNPDRRFLVGELCDRGSQLCALGQNYGSLDRVLQFPDIARPLVSYKGRYHIVGDVLD